MSFKRIYLFILYFTTLYYIASGGDIFNWLWIWFDFKIAFRNSPEEPSVTKSDSNKFTEGFLYEPYLYSTAAAEYLNKVNV
jgi:hypothetical protein